MAAVAQLSSSRQQRKSHLQWVPLGDLIVSERAQAAFRPAHANAIARNFNLEGLGFPVVSHRGGHFYIIDGQHRVQAARIFGFAPEDVFQCEVYEDLTEKDEADLFLERNEIKQKSAYEKYRVSIVAGRPEETDVDRCVRAQGLRVAGTTNPGAVVCVSTLMRVYRRSGAIVLGRTIRIIRDSFGDGAYEAPLVDALSLVLARYPEAFITEDYAVSKLSKVPRGVLGLKAAAERTKLATSHKFVDCLANSIVETLNKGRNSSSVLRLAPWFKS